MQAPITWKANELAREVDEKVRTLLHESRAYDVSEMQQTL